MGFLSAQLALTYGPAVSTAWLIRSILGTHFRVYFRVIDLPPLTPSCFCCGLLHPDGTAVLTTHVAILLMCCCSHYTVYHNYKRSFPVHKSVNLSVSKIQVDNTSMIYGWYWWMMNNPVRVMVTTRYPWLQVSTMTISFLPLFPFHGNFIPSLCPHWWRSHTYSRSFWFHEGLFYKNFNLRLFFTNLGDSLVSSMSVWLQNRETGKYWRVGGHRDAVLVAKVHDKCNDEYKNAAVRSLVFLGDAA